MFGGRIGQGPRLLSLLPSPTNPSPPMPTPFLPPLPQKQLVEAAEAKAYYGLASNYKALTALASALQESESLTGAEVRAILDGQGERSGWFTWPTKRAVGMGRGRGGAQGRRRAPRRAGDRSHPLKIPSLKIPPSIPSTAPHPPPPQA